MASAVAESAPSGGARVRRFALSAAVVFCLAGFVVQPWLAWPCPLRIVCGVPCPTCGMTRAARLAFGAHWGDATRMHPLWFVVLPVACALVAIELAGYVRSGQFGASARFTRARAVRRALQTTVAAVIVVWIARFFGAFGGPAPI